MMNHSGLEYELGYGVVFNLKKTHKLHVCWLDGPTDHHWAVQTKLAHHICFLNTRGQDGTIDPSDGQLDRKK